MKEIERYERMMNDQIAKWSLWPLDFICVDDIYIRVVNDQIVQWFKYKGDDYASNPIENTIPLAGFYPLLIDPQIVRQKHLLYKDVIADVLHCSMRNDLDEPTYAPENICENMRKRMCACDDYVWKNIRRVFRRVSNIQEYIHFMIENNLQAIINELGLDGFLQSFQSYKTSLNNTEYAEFISKIRANKYKNATNFSINGVKFVQDPNNFGECEKYDFPYAKVVYLNFRDLTLEEKNELDCNFNTTDRIDVFRARLNHNVLLEMILHDLHITATDVDKVIQPDNIDTRLKNSAKLLLSIKINHGGKFNLLLQHWMLMTLVDKKGEAIKYDTKTENNCNLFVGAIFEIVFGDYSPGSGARYIKLVKYHHYLMYMGYDFNDRENFLRLLYSILNYLGMYRPIPKN